MEIKTKYNIGQRVWYPEINKTGGNATIDLASGIISGISIEKDNKIEYFFDEWCCDVEEEEIIAYEDTEKLINKLIELDNQIIKEKENK